VALVALPVNVNVVPVQSVVGLADAVTDNGIVSTATDAVFTFVAAPHTLLAVKV
jgi:hypothetical protein